MRRHALRCSLALLWLALFSLSACETADDGAPFGGGGGGDAVDASGGDDVAVNETSEDGAGGSVDAWTDGGGAPDVSPDVDDVDGGDAPDVPPDTPYDVDVDDVDGGDAPDVPPDTPYDVDDVDGGDAPDVPPDTPYDVDVDDVDGGDAPDVPPDTPYDTDDVDGGDAPDVPPDGTCSAPVYSSDCAKVPYFECGWEASCSDGVIEAFWHEHVFCDGVEEIVEYSCTLDCMETCPAEDYIEWPESGAAMAETYCQTEPCEYPSYSDDCAEVDYFQCGFEASCEDGVVQAFWHEHVFCPGAPVEDIVDYSCATVCPGACKPGEIYDWPEDGAGLIEAYCE